MRTFAAAEFFGALAIFGVTVMLATGAMVLTFRGIRARATRRDPNYQMQQTTERLVRNGLTVGFFAGFVIIGFAIGIDVLLAPKIAYNLVLG